MVIRSKFRVLSYVERDQLTIELHPVSVRSRYDPDGSEENAKWWAATPSGTLHLAFKSDEKADARAKYPVGSAWFVDVSPDPAGGWTLGNVEVMPGAGMKFRLIGEPYGTAFEAQIDNYSAAALILPHVVAAFDHAAAWREENDGKTMWDAASAVKDRWSVTLSPA